MKSRNLIVLPLVGALVAGCGGSNENSNYMPMTRKNATPEAVEKATKSLGTGKGAKVMAGATDFAFRYARQVIAEKPTSNELVSPLSLATVLAMASNGANGGTKDAFDKVLGVENTLPNEVNQAYKDLQTTLIGADGKVTVHVANSLWIDKAFEFKRDFLGRTNDFFGAKAQPIDLSNPAAADAINDWVKLETEQKIPKLFDKLDADAKAVLVNAVYFMGKWTEPFDKSATKDANFTDFAGKSKAIPMMRRSSEQIDYLASESFTAVRLPYGDGRISMVVMLPNEKGGVGAVTKELNAKNWAAWAAKFKAKAGTVSMPKWTVEASYDLKPSLKELGLGIAMDPAKADFSGLANVKPGEMYLSQIVQKTFIVVDEEGAEAAAATGAAISTTSAPMPTERFEFIANRPFVYAIVDKQTSAILFFGVYGKP